MILLVSIAWLTLVFGAIALAVAAGRKAPTPAPSPVSLEAGFQESRGKEDMQLTTETTNPKDEEPTEKQPEGEQAPEAPADAKDDESEDDE